MIPVNQFILGSSDPLLYPSEKMTNSIDEQIAFLQSQKQAINEAYRRNAVTAANNGVVQNQQPVNQGIWDAIDAEIAPLTQEQQNMLLNNQDYVNNYNALQSMVQAEVLNLVRRKIEASEDGKHLLEEQLKLVKLLKSKIVEVTNKEMELFKAFKEASKTNPNLTEVVEQMYHVKDNKKYIGEKYDMNKAHEICERYKEVLPNDVEPCDVYVAINAQYHDYAKLFEEWFGGNIDNKVFESAITFWFKDVDFDGDKVWEYFHMNN